MNQVKKTLLIVAGSIVLFVVIVILFISPITKYMVEKYDVQLTGREMKMDWAYVNPFTGYIYFHNFRVYEYKSDSVFLSTKGLSMHLALGKLLSKNYHVNNLTLDEPRCVVINTKNTFNFDDLIKKFTAQDTTLPKATPTHLNVLNFKVVDGVIYYRDNTIPINYFIKKLRFESPGIRWDKDTIAAKFDFLPGTDKGTFKGDFVINSKTEDYKFNFKIDKFDLNILLPFLKEISHFGTFSANLDANLNAVGNFKEAQDITAKGLLRMNDFHFGKNKQEDYASFDHLAVQINELNPKKNTYMFDSASLTHPFIKYEQYDHLNNFENMFGKGGSAVSDVKADSNQFNVLLTIATYVKQLAQNFLQSNYKVNKMAITNADFRYSDFSTNEQFTMALNPMNAFADSIEKSNKLVNFKFRSAIKPYGDAAVLITINPRKSADFDLAYNFENIPLTLFNPYTLSYTSFPLDKGTLGLNGAWQVRNGIIDSKNHLIIVDPRVTKRVRNKDEKWLPLPLIMSFVRERGNVIDYEIPITGNLKNPRFHYHDVVFDVLKNIFVKPATTAYRLQLKSVETEIEKTLTLKWQLRQNKLRSTQEKFVKKIADFLDRTPEASIMVYPLNYELKEKEYILFYEAKKRYFLLTHNKNDNTYTEDDSEKVDKMSVKDTVFVKYLDKVIHDPLIFTIQEKCGRFVSPALLNATYKQLNAERERLFLSYFKEKGLDRRISFANATATVPFNGFSYYRLKYKGEYPKDLLKAYQDLNEFNEQAPREKFQKELKTTLSKP